MLKKMICRWITVKSLLVVLLVLFCLSANAQVKGNKQMVTKTYPLEKLTSIEMNLYATVEINCAGEEEITITADENLLDLIDGSVDHGHMKLTQKKWIQPSRKIAIRIGAPGLERIRNTVHETVVIQNIDRENFQAIADLGKIVLSGKVEVLNASGEAGIVDLKNLEAGNISENFRDGGKVLLSDTEVTRIDTRFIEFKVKNNSANRIQCYVKGPKPDGTYFSYGFPMNPGQTRNKNWTIGSKVYRMTGLGTKKLLAEIKASDEGEVVKLYEK